MKVFAWAEASDITKLVFSGFNTSVEAKHWKRKHTELASGLELVHFVYGNLYGTVAIYEDTEESRVQEALDYFVREALSGCEGDRILLEDAYDLLDVLEEKLGIKSTVRSSESKDGFLK